MRPLLLLALSSGMLFAAPVPKVAKKADDNTLLEGRWESVSLDTGGGVRQDNTWWVEFKEGKLTTGCGLTKGYVGRAFKLDSTTSPKRLDIDDLSGQFMFTAYALDGDTLIWCESSSTTNRPADLATAGGFNVFVLKRAKSE